MHSTVVIVLLDRYKVPRIKFLLEPWPDQSKKSFRHPVIYRKGISEALVNVLRPLDLWVVYRTAPWKRTLSSGIKDKVPERLKKGVVYSVPCCDCNSVYIGETQRNLETWL